MVSLRTGGREAVEDTPVTGATEEHAELLRTFSQRAGISSPTEQWADISERRKNQWRSLVNAMANDGYVIVRAEDALTADDRAAMKYLASFFDGYKAPEQVGCAAWEVKGTIEAIAAGGQA